MKKSLFGYRITDVDTLISSLKEENESLNDTITTLKAELKNSSDNETKSTILEDDYQKIKEQLALATSKNQELISDFQSLSLEVDTLRQQNLELTEQLHTQLDIDFTKEASATVEPQSYKEPKDNTSPETPIENSNTNVNLEDRLSTENQYYIDANKNSQISSYAYYSMCKMRNEVLSYVQEQIKDFHRMMNEYAMKRNSAVEQIQGEYNQLLRDFFMKANAYRINLSNIDTEYNSLHDFNFNTEKLNENMNAIMEKFINEFDNKTFFKK